MNLLDVNSPTRDQQILFDRAGNSQDQYENDKPSEHRNLMLSNQQKRKQDYRDVPDNYHSYSPTRQNQGDSYSKYKKDHYNTNPNNQVSGKHIPKFQSVIYSVDCQPKPPSSHNGRPISRQSQKPFNAGTSKAHEPPLLKPQKEPYIGKKTLVLDLDETLVHSSFKKIKNADIRQPIDIEGYL